MIHHTLMKDTDIYDVTLINAINSLLQKLRRNQMCKKRLYRIEQVNEALITLENMYEGVIDSDYTRKVERFEASLNTALTELKPSSDFSIG